VSAEPRYATPRDESRATLGPSVAAVADKLGMPLMEWQCRIADVALEIDSATGRLAYRDVVVTCPRQQGKSSLLLALRVHRAVHPHFGGPQQILWTAQSRLAARTKWSDVQVPLLERSPFGGMFKPRYSTGQESLLWRNGSRDAITASGETSGHGETLDLALIDEAWAQRDHRLEQAMRPTMLTRPEPQLWIVSTAGDLDSRYLRAKVDIGRDLVGGEPVAYFEWAAGEDDDPGDPATWAGCMPALGVTITTEAVAADFASMPVDEFKRSHLNLWADTRSDPIFDLTQWEACKR
jgi:phage terminase large subunit-like protein